MTEQKPVPVETPKPKRWGSFWRNVGRAIGRVLRGGAAVVLLAATLSTSCALKEFGHNGVQVVIGIAEGFFGVGEPPVEPVPEPRPGPDPTRTPVVISPTPTWSPSPSPSPTPGPVVTVPPAVPPAPVGVDLTTCLRRNEVPAQPVPIFTGKPCKIREGFVPIEQGGCVRNWLCADGDQEYQPVKKIGDSLRWGGPEGVHRCGEFICDAGRPGQEAYGRNVDGNGNVIVPPAGDPDHDTPWSRAGLCKPVWCEEVPQATPTRTPAPRAQPGCIAVETTPHTMAPGNHCHAWQKQNGEIHCLVDSTIRPICDEAHMDNWNSFCGQRTHDPDFNTESMEWFVNGAADLGPNPRNYAQRWIRGAPGAQVSVTVCIPPNKRTPDGCLIVRQADGCGSRVFILPEGE